MKLKFIINPADDYQMSIIMLHGDDWEYRAKSMCIDHNLAKKIHQSQKDIPAKLKRELSKVIDDQYKRVLPYMEKTKVLYQNSWDEIMEDFSQTVADLTCPWFYDEYTCVVTHFVQGISNWNGNVIGRWWKENPYLQRRITAHEILLAHYFSIYRNHFSDRGLSDKQIWVLAEIAGFALTGLEDKLTKFWSWDTSGYYTNHNYPNIVRLQKQLRDVFIARNNFKEYIEKGIELVRNDPLV